MKDVAILASVRSAIGKSKKGSLRDTRPDVFGSIILKDAIKKACLNPKDIEDVIIGCSMPEGEQGMNISKTICSLSGLPYSVSGATVNRLCASGLQAISDIAKSIQTGQIEVGIGGGVESMTMVPMGGFRPTVCSQLSDIAPEFYTSMGLTAELVAAKFNITREEQDKFSLLSHEKSINAINLGYFKNEIVGFEVSIIDKPGIVSKKWFDTDECPRYDTSLSALSKLLPAFSINGSVTAGNASQISDGAAISVLMEKEAARSKSLPILGYFRAFCTIGVPPEIMGIGPAVAIRKLLNKTGLKINDIGIFEINEAFAAQVIYCIKELNLDQKLVNPNGGSIALGHPLGCTGARQVTTILHELRRTNKRFGICSMCIGGGMGAAALIEVN